MYQEAKEKRKIYKGYPILGFIRKLMMLGTPALLYIKTRKVEEGSGGSLPYCLVVNDR
jgi:hypothetical protein